MLMKHSLSPRRASAHRRGFTLTEAAIVLGIVGLILGGIWVAAGAVYNNQRVSTTTTQIMQIVNGIRSLYATSTTFTGDETDLANAGVIPRDMLVLDASNAVTDVVNVWNGQVTIAAAAPATSFTITIEDVPRAACSSLLVKFTGPGRDSGLEEAGTTPLTVGGAGLTVPQATAECSDATDNDMVFQFALRS
ncbi:MAG: type 4 pilus major pilin [Bdellovibrionales bacterium]